MNQKYALGLDIGISSVGWGIVLLDTDNNPYRILDAGVKIFSAAEVPKTGASKTEERRKFRGARRILRRREHRIDRVRRLLNLHGFLGETILTGKADEIYIQLTYIYENLLQEYYKNKNIDPYILKVEALDRKLTPTELSIILVHYVKHRGYKSNRDSDGNDSEIGKVKESLNYNRKLMSDKKYRTVSEMFIKDSMFSDKKRNSPDCYNTCVERDLYQQEIETVLNQQIIYGLITQKFKEEYMNIWLSQRSYAKGPGGNSKYGGDLIARMTGICKFDGEPRAPKCAPSAEIFVALTTLSNLRYKETRNDDYKKLSKEQLKKILDLAKKQDKITFDRAFKEIGLSHVIIKGMMLTSKEKETAKVAFLKNTRYKEFNYSELGDEERKKYDIYRIDSINKRTLIELKSYNAMRKIFSKQYGLDKWNQISQDISFLDKIAIILTNNKTDEDVESAVKKYNIDDSYVDAIKALPNFKDHNKLSLNIIRQLNAYLLQGMAYEDAMKKIGYNHALKYMNSEKHDLLIPINEDNEITNQRVIRSLAQSRSIINSIIKKYGMPEIINIETARELSKSRQEQREIQKRRDENENNNSAIKKMLVSNGIFSTIEKISSTDILKYKLWIEQQEYCSYSLEKISIEQLFDYNQVQIDHILPYSRTFDDTYFNKTLVLTKYNQEKGNKTPYEWIGNTEKWNKFEKYINSLDIPTKKKDNYLLKNLTLEIESDYRNQNLNDTKYVTKYLVSYIKANLNIKKVGSPSGSITGKLRNYWHLNGLTHSLNSKDYYLKDRDKKNRDNHLHHAMDALVIAVTTDKLVKRVSDFERYRRYIDYKSVTNLIHYLSDTTAEFDINKYVDDNGEILESNLREYAKEVRDKEYFRTRKNGTIQLLAPLPYSNFAEEAKVRIYERDKKQMDFSLKGMGYTDVELSDVLPIIPKFARENISGALHKETYYGLSADGNYKTSRIDIASASFNEKLLEKIVEKDGGSKDIYLAVKKWLNGSTGDKAYKSNGGYPLKPKTKDNSYIKKIKIQEPYNGKGHILKNNKLVARDDVVQINIYKKQNDDKLYFVGLDRLDLVQLKKNQNIDLTLWWGRGKNYKIMNQCDVNKEYKLYLSLRKNEYIKIILKDGREGYGYTVGFSSGLFEITSPLGDFTDLVTHDKLFLNFRDHQYCLTVSTIQFIEKIKLNNLGKIE